MKSLILVLFISLLLFDSAHAVELKFGSQNFPPFCFEENGKSVGPAVEILQAMCASAKVTCQTPVLPWRRAQRDAESGALDGIFVIKRTPERAAHFTFSDPFVRSTYSFYTMPSSKWRYKASTDLDGMNIGVYGPSGTSSTLQELVGLSNNATVQIDINNQSVLNKLIAGHYGEKGIIFINKDVANALIKSDGLAGFRFAGDGVHFEYTFAFSKKSPNAAYFAALNHGLRNLKKSGKLKVILAKYGLEVARK